MKNQGNRTGGLLLLIFGLAVGVFSVVVTAVLVQVSSRMESFTMPINLFPLIPGGFASLLLVGVGLSMLIKGGQSRKIMQIGRKTECKVHNVLRVRNGYQLIVSFRGDSGNQFMHSLYISYKDAALLKPDMVLECYVNGDDCYIDESRIVVKEKTGF